MRKTTQLRRLLERDEVLVCPGVYDAYTAKIVERVGFNAAYMTGYGVSVATLGMPDVGLATMTEMHDVARRIVNAIDIPIIADSDTGYGNAVNVIRAVRGYIQTGVAAIHLEDQVIPKRCGHVEGKMVVPLEEAAGKIRAAHETRMEDDPDFVLIARTDALGAAGGGIDEAIRRCNAFGEAGADLVFVDGVRSREQLERITRETSRPLLYNNGGISPIVDFDELQRLGVAVSIFPGLALRTTGGAWWDFLTDFKERGVQAQRDQESDMEGHPMSDLHAFSGIRDMREVEERYLPAEEIALRYESGQK